MLYVELAIVLALIAVNGVLAMSELALVSARRGRLEAMAARGHKGAQAALAIMAEPGRFHSAVQIGITLVGLAAGAFSGATIAERAANGLRGFGMAPAAADTVAYVVVIAAITYFSVIVGELVPKQLALRNAERIAVAVAGPMSLVSKIFAPVVWLLDGSARLGLRLFGTHDPRAGAVTDEEIKTLIAEAERLGVVEPEERTMISGVMRLADKPVRAIMTPRLDIVWLNLEDSEDELRAAIRKAPHSRLPVASGSIDKVLGVLPTKELLDAMLDDRSVRIRDLIQPVPAVSDAIDALTATEQIRQSPMRLVVVVDEQGVLEGIVTEGDILRAIAGELIDHNRDTAHVTRREDGSFLIDGSMSADALAELLKIALPAERNFHTAAGFVLDHLRHLPKVGEVFPFHGWRFEIVDLDGLKIDKLLVSRQPALHREPRTRSGAATPPRAGKKTARAKPTPAADKPRTEKPSSEKSKREAKRRSPAAK
ncbi:MAG: hemolysin family protein [Alphaproteobacteria bacterium]